MVFIIKFSPDFLKAGLHQPTKRSDHGGVCISKCCFTSFLPFPIYFKFAIAHSIIPFTFVNHSHILFALCYVAIVLTRYLFYMRSIQFHPASAAVATQQFFPETRKCTSLNIVREKNVQLVQNPNIDSYLNTCT